MVKFMSKKRVEVIKESVSGRNQQFKDNQTGVVMSRQKFVSDIKKGLYEEDYYVRKQHGVETPVSKPDGNKKNNLD
jgi:hypothetical protein